MKHKYLKWKDAPIWLKICRNIKDARKCQNKTPEYVAENAGIDLKRYKRIERAMVNDITFDEACKIADALKIDFDNITYY